MDTAGMHHFPAMRELSIKSSQGVILVYSVDSQASFLEALQMRELVVAIKGKVFMWLTGGGGAIRK